jgi:hypothetical protein
MKNNYFCVEKISIYTHAPFTDCKIIHQTLGYQQHFAMGYVFKINLILENTILKQGNGYKDTWENSFQK